MDFRNITVLAPMAGATDSIMRLLCTKMGADMAVSEMVSAKALCYKDKKTAVLTKIAEGECPVAIQLFGHEPSVMAEAAVMIAVGSFDGCSYASPPVAVDVNMGCPVKKIVTSGDGSALMKDPDVAVRIVEEMTSALKKYNMPLTVKIRSGWDKKSINAPEFAKALVGAGAVAVAVHARTRDQMYSPSADISVIGEVKAALGSKVPVIGNGDIVTAEDALRMKRETGCDSVMIGRAALGDPWIFSHIKALEKGLEPKMPTAEDRVMCALSLVRDLVKEKGEELGVREARGRCAHFIRGLSGSAAVRDSINRSVTLDEIENILLSWRIKQ